MPPERHRGRYKGNSNLTEAQKGAIVTLRKHNKYDFPTIAGLLELSQSTPQKVFKSLHQAAAGDSEREPTLLELLGAVTTPKPPGRPPLVQNGTTLSAQIRASIIQFGTYDIEDAVSHVLHAAGLTLDRKTIIKIAHNHRDATNNFSIVKRVRPKKPELDDDDLADRERYCTWIIYKFDHVYPKIVFVCYDETPKRIGGRNTKGGKQYVWMPKGRDANSVPCPYRPPAFTLMICAATSSDTTVSYLRPCIVWSLEDNDTHEETLKRIQEANTKAKEAVRVKRSRATVAGTQEERALQELNNNIRQNNTQVIAANKAANKKGGSLRKGTQRLKTVEQFFPEEEFVYKSGKGMNGIWYAERILKDHVFPYYCAVRDHNPDSEVYLVQDNVYLHTLGLRYCAPEIEELKIKFAPQSTNSPDLHPIEVCFGRLEGFLWDYEVTGSSKKAKADAEEFIRSVWQEDETMRQYMAEHLHPQYFYNTAQACKQAKYQNNFKA